MKLTLQIRPKAVPSNAWMFDTLCWKCANAYDGCLWARSRGEVPMDWPSYIRMPYYAKGPGVAVSYTVLKCDEFVEES